MADRPPRRLPASLQRLVSVFEGNLDAELDQAPSDSRNEGFLPESEVATESDSNISNLSMSAEELDEDDLLDSEEEYLKEMEQQRLEDLKNGHYCEELQPPIKLTATPDEVASYIAASFIAATVVQDVAMGEEETSSLEKENNRANQGRSDGSTRLHVGILSHADSVENMGDKYILSYGGACANSKVNESLSSKKHVAAEITTPTLLENTQELNAATYSSFSAKNNTQGNLFSLIGMERMATRLEDLNGEKMLSLIFRRLDLWCSNNMVWASKSGRDLRPPLLSLRAR